MPLTNGDALCQVYSSVRTRRRATEEGVARASRVSAAAARKVPHRRGAAAAAAAAQRKSLNDVDSEDGEADDDGTVAGALDATRSLVAPIDLGIVRCKLINGMYGIPRGARVASYLKSVTSVSHAEGADMSGRVADVWSDGGADELSGGSPSEMSESEESESEESEASEMSDSDSESQRAVQRRFKQITGKFIYLPLHFVRILLTV